MNGQKFFPLVVVAAGLLAYHNSFTGAFVFDDLASIPQNPTIRHLWPIWQPLSPPHRGWLTVEGRPLINLSLAVNYALGGYNVWGYHALNLAVHIFAGLALLGIVRRTLLQPALRDRFGAAANELALTVAVLWTVHPLQTESVTYIIQRAESIMGLFYLLTLYCFIRGAESLRAGGGRLWYGLCVGACLLGMASKEVMATAPVMVMLYDRAFLSKSFREAWRRRRPLYLFLASTWVLLGWLAILTVSNALANAQHIGLTWWQYLATQPGVILHYLRLSVWPSPLCMNNPWPIARTWRAILPSALVVSILLGATAWAWRSNPVWGFVGAWFFLILAPSSSILPAHDAMYEHRMYLSLAAVVSVVMMGSYAVAGRRSLVVFAAVAIGLGFLTWRRNQDYRSEVALWMDTVAKYPNEPMDHYNFGIILQRAGKIEEALSQYERAVSLRHDYAEAHNNLGIVLAEAGKTNDAIEHFEEAVRLKPDHVPAQNNLAVMLWCAGRTQDAIARWQQSLRVRPHDAEALNNYGTALRQMGKTEQAIRCWEDALQANPDYTEAQYNLAEALKQTGQFQLAVGHYEQVLQTDPENVKVHYGLGVALWQTGRVSEAIQEWEQAVRLKPDYADAHNSLGNALMRVGQVAEAIEHYEQAVRIDADYAEAQNNLGSALFKAGRPKEAIQHFDEALRTRPDYAMAHYNLGSAFEQTGRIQEAIAQYEQAVHIKHDFQEAQKALTRLRAAQ